MSRSFTVRSFAALLLLMTAVVLGQAQTAGRPASNPTSKIIDAGQLLKDIEYLSSDELEGRSADLPSMAKAREYVEKRFREAGLKPLGDGYQQEFEFTPRRSETKLKGINFIGQIKGSKKADKYIVITAHYDHDGIRNGRIYNGADDNASGT
ncbi:MAG: M28 family peptidase, partial [Acidobacteria bacterium]|nr:M28 family peptidase [Acidobacteriota bacterium]